MKPEERSARTSVSRWKLNLGCLLMNQTWAVEFFFAYSVLSDAPHLGVGHINVPQAAAEA